MKKFYILSLLMVFAVASFAQRTAIPGKKLTNVEFTKTPTDTLVPIGNLGTPTLYSSTGGGFVCGNNGYGDVAKVQAYINTSNINVEGMLFWCGAKELVGGTGTVAANCYDMTGSATISTGTGSGPGTVLGFVTLPMSSIDSGLSAATGFNAVTFTTPINVTSDFALGIDMTNIGSDTIGIVSSTDAVADGSPDGDPAGAELTFDKWSDATWHSFLETGNWSLDIDMFIWAVIDANGAGVGSEYFFDGIKLSQNQPNPANAMTMIQYELQNAGNVTLEVYDMTGRLVVNVDEGKQNAGSHSILIDSEKLQEGAYYYSLKSDSHRLTKKMVVTK
jgi:hypothetical protein